MRLNIHDLIVIAVCLIFLAATTPATNYTYSPVDMEITDSIYVIGDTEITEEEVVEFGFIPTLKGGGEKQFSNYEIVIWLLKRNEGLHLVPYWDVKQWTSGWGTKAAHKDEKITLAIANERARDGFQDKLNLIRKRYPNLDDFTAKVIAQFLYNVGDDGIGSGLDKALKSGDTKRICTWLKKYIRADGKKNDGLIERRERECRLLMSSEEERQKLAREYQKEVIQFILAARK